MAATTLRVHSLAKELGVPSKVIIAKCAAEGIELKNHMAAISVGLAESIREWFSVGADITSVEVAEKIDVESVRQTRRKVAKPSDLESPETAEELDDEEQADIAASAELAAVETADELALQEAETTLAVEQAEREESPAISAPAPVEPAAEVAVAPLEEPATLVERPAASAVPSAPEVEESKPVAEEPEPTKPEVVAPVIIQPPPPPQPIMPAGPQVVPKPAALQGPRVVRVEAPEPQRPPRPRVGGAAARGPGDRYPRPAGGPTASSSSSSAPSTTAPRKGRGKGRKDEAEDARARSRSPRRHGGGASDVDQRVREWRDQDLLERKERLASVTGHGLRDRRAAERRRQATTQTGAAPSSRRDPVAIIAPVALKDFCATLGISFVVVSRKLMEQTGRLWTINQSMDAEQTELLAMELGIPVAVRKAKTAYEALEEEFALRERKNLKPRPPVVAMLGHVDHGKTSLLDAIRSANVAKGEAGGITQHIGAYRIQRDKWDVTFVDTPGHEAFTAMRARGANLTDVVVLVVAADDGVMPQTAEAITHAKAAKVAIVVALNKIDLPGIDLNRVYAQLSEHDLTPTEWGGSTDVIKTSATTKQGVDDLIAHLSTLSELMELQADPTVPAHATVIEAQLREGQGVVAQVLVREGTLRPGQTIVCGPGAGRIRSLMNDQGKMIREATPGTPVEVSGLTELPIAGDRLYEVKNLARAKDIAQEVRDERRAAALRAVTAPTARTLEQLVQSGAEAEIPELTLILRADVHGSVEVLQKSLASFPADKARLNVLQAAVGAVTEADVHLAKASGALIVGFHVVAEDRARQLADQLGVEIRQYRVIYEILDDVQKALAGLLAPEEVEESRGAVEVRQVFNVSRVGTIAGCYVTDGIVGRNHKVRLVRDGRIILEHGNIDSLKRFKDDAREVRAGLECGIKLAGFDDIKPGDVIQTYELIEVAQEL